MHWPQVNGDWRQTQSVLPLARPLHLVSGNCAPGLPSHAWTAWPVPAPHQLWLPLAASSPQDKQANQGSTSAHQGVEAALGQHNERQRRLVCSLGQNVLGRASSLRGAKWDWPGAEARVRWLKKREAARRVAELASRDCVVRSKVGLAAHPSASRLRPPTCRERRALAFVRPAVPRSAVACRTCRQHSRQQGCSLPFKHDYLILTCPILPPHLQLALGLEEGANFGGRLLQLLRHKGGAAVGCKGRGPGDGGVKCNEQWVGQQVQT